MRMAQDHGCGYDPMIHFVKCCFSARQGTPVKQLHIVVNVATWQSHSSSSSSNSRAMLY